MALNSPALLGASCGLRIFERACIDQLIVNAYAVYQMRTRERRQSGHLRCSHTQW
jgi:hypothetical protein